MELTQAQRELQAYIEQENEEAQRKAEAQGIIRFPVVPNAEHWADFGVYNVEGYRHYMAAETYSELMKDCWNVRVNSADLEKLSADEMEAKLNEEIRTLNELEERDRKEEEAALKARREANKDVSNNPFAGLRDMMSR